MASWRFLRQLLGFGEIAISGRPHFFILLTIHEDLPEPKKNKCAYIYNVRVYVTNTLHLKKMMADDSTKFIQYNFSSSKTSIITIRGKKQHRKFSCTMQI
jgi:hypothetical protein